jgi:hypothetical protein
MTAPAGRNPLFIPQTPLSDPTPRRYINMSPPHAPLPPIPEENEDDEDSISVDQIAMSDLSLSPPPRPLPETPGEYSDDDSDNSADSVERQASLDLAYRTWQFERARLLSQLARTQQLARVKNIG